MYIVHIYIYKYKHSYDLAERGEAFAGAQLDDAKSGHEVQERDLTGDSLPPLTVDLGVVAAVGRQVVVAKTRSLRCADVAGILEVVLAENVQEGLRQLNHEQIVETMVSKNKIII